MFRKLRAFLVASPERAAPTGTWPRTRASLFFAKDLATYPLPILAYTLLRNSRTRIPILPTALASMPFGLYLFEFAVAVTVYNLPPLRM